MKVIIFILTVISIYSCQSNSNKKPRFDISESITSNDTFYLKPSFWNRLFSNNSKKKITGLLFEKYENGNLKYECEIINGVVSGIKRVYYENGKLKFESTYVKGIEFGIQKVYYENGLIEDEISIKNGIKDGFARKWYKNGKLCRELNYKNDVLDGTCRYYRISGQIISEHKYKFKEEDLKDITSHSWRSVKVNQTEYDINSHLLTTGSYNRNPEVIPDILNGTQREWFENGKIKSIENYNLGKKDGLQKFYFENGFIEKEEIWKNNILISMKCWNEIGVALTCK